MRDQLAPLREQAFGAPGTDNVVPIQAAPTAGPARRAAMTPAVEAEPIAAISTELVGFRYT